MTTLKQNKRQLEADEQEIQNNKDLTEEQKKNQIEYKQASYALSNKAQLQSLIAGEKNEAVSSFANLALKNNLYDKDKDEY